MTTVAWIRAKGGASLRASYPRRPQAHPSLATNLRTLGPQAALPAGARAAIGRVMGGTSLRVTGVWNPKACAAQHPAKQMA